VQISAIEHPPLAIAPGSKTLRTGIHFIGYGFGGFGGGLHVGGVVCSMLVVL